MSPYSVQNLVFRAPLADSTICSVANADISGIGVRISFYIQSFFSISVAWTGSSASRNILLTFMVTNIALTIAALVERNAQQLSLFDAIEVSYLLWLTTFAGLISAWMIMAPKRNTMRSSIYTDYLNLTLVFMESVYTAILTILMWAGAADFGNQPECNTSIQFVVFGLSVQAVTSGRVVGIVIASLFTALFGGILLVIILPMPRFFFGKESGFKPLICDPFSRTRNAILTTLHLGAVVYLIICNEIFIQRNQYTVEASSQWGFGQILTILMLFPSVVALAASIPELRG